MHKIKLINGKSFLCSEEETILDAAKKNGIFLNHSCMTGRCGACKSQYIGETIIIQKEIITNQNLKNNEMLTCCRAPKSDLYLETEDLSDLANYPTKLIPCKISNIKYMNNDVLEIYFRTPPSDKLNFLPGQYIDVIIPNGLRRSYSISNAPRLDGLFSLQIKRIKNGLMSNYWFNKAKINDLLRVEGPLGSFYLRKNQNQDFLILLATGTGIAPIKAILEQINSAKECNNFKQIILYWGGRYENDLYWNPSFKNLPFIYCPVLSREKSKCISKAGYVQDNVINDKVSLDKSVVYACGSEVMIQSAIKVLCKNGLLKQNFYSDAFVSSTK